MGNEQTTGGMGGVSNPPNGWKEVWENRPANDSPAADLSELLRADGFDTPLASISDRAWRLYVKDWAAKLGMGSGSSVFEVGCGAGAFLQVLKEMGCSVGGCDFSSSQIALARSALPDSELHVCEAQDIANIGTWDFVVANGVFMYFPTLQYAAEVCKLMCKSSLKGIAILDIPDLKLKARALQIRIAAAGGPSEYAQRYSTLDHQYYDQEWVASQLRDSGLNRVTTVRQNIEGYGNAAFRFNAWGFHELGRDAK